MTKLNQNITKMVLSTVRNYATKIRPAVKIPNEQHLKGKKTTFDRSFPLHRRQKAWEKDGMDKGDWFKKKYAHIHAREKEDRLKNGQYDKYGKRKSFEDKIKHQAMNQKEQYKLHKSKFSKTHPLQGLKPNPLIDYVYGTNSVISALSAKKREYFIKAYHYGLINPKVESLCKASDIRLEEVDKHKLNLLTNYGVHNNVVLECKPLEPVELSHLGLVNTELSTFERMEIEFDQAAPTSGSYLTSNIKKFPLGIYLDSIVDPHNVGAIIRSAYFLGADFLILSHKNCAPLSPVVSKVSSGTMELLPIYTCAKPLQFFEKSKQDGGWAFVSSNLKLESKKYNEHLEMSDLNGILGQLPVILVVGNEGSGIRTNLLQRSDYTVNVPFGRPPEELDGSVDSLNVSVATALLINEILK